MPNAPLPLRSVPGRKSGTLSLFPVAGPERPAAGAADAVAAAGTAAASAGVPYARFRLCRGFIDDLNRILPIRARIRLEGELAQGLTRGEMDAPVRFRWEFVEH